MTHLRLSVRHVVSCSGISKNPRVLIVTVARCHSGISVNLKVLIVTVARCHSGISENLRVLIVTVAHWHIGTDGLLFWIVAVSQRHTGTDLCRKPPQGLENISTKLR